MTLGVRTLAAVLTTALLVACTPLRERPEKLELKQLCTDSREMVFFESNGDRFRQGIASTVRIRAIRSAGGCSPVREAGGTGVIIDSKRGLILTAAHVVCGARRVEIFTLRLSADGEVEEVSDMWADVLSRDADTDSAILMVRRQHVLPPAMKMACRWPPVPWAPVIHYGQTSRISVGQVRQLIVSEKRSGKTIAMIETTATARAGDSGGPLTNLNGRLVGIVLQKHRIQPYSYSVHLTEVVSAHDGKKPAPSD